MGNQSRDAREIWAQYRHLVAFRRAVRKRRWPGRHEEFPPGNPLGRFCALVNPLFRKGRLPHELLHRLACLRFPLRLGKSPWHREEHEELRSRYPFLEVFLWQYENLKRFRKQHPDRWPGDTECFSAGNPLGRWVTRLRRDFRHKRLPPYQVKLLNALDFFWEGELEWRWRRDFLRLKDHIARHPRSWRSSLPTSLDSWIRNQRRLMALEKLPEDKRQTLLKAMGPLFHPQGRWGQGYEALKAFRRRHPDRWPRMAELDPQGFPIGKWCLKQRHRHKQGDLKEKQRKLLRALDFPFVARAMQAQWLKQFEYLQAFRAHHHQWPEYTQEFPIGNALGIWCSLQRTLEARGRLKPDRRSLLNQIGFPLERMHQDWEARYSELAAWMRRRKGRLPTDASGDPEESRQFFWIIKQRTAFNAGDLPESKRRRLRSLGVLK